MVAPPAEPDRPCRRAEPAVAAEPSEPAGHVDRTGPPDVGAATTLVLLRHGVTAHTVDRRFSGSSAGEGPGLTDWAAPRPPPPRRSLASSTVRPGGRLAYAACAADRRGRRRAGSASDVRTDAAWTECEFGDWEGRTTARSRERWPDEYRAWLASTAVPPPGGGASTSSTRGSAASATARSPAHPRGRVLVVTHAGPIKTMAREAMGAPAQVVWRMESSAGVRDGDAVVVGRRLLARLVQRDGPPVRCGHRPTLTP